jgi:hypothetical protein
MLMHGAAQKGYYMYRLYAKPNIFGFEAALYRAVDALPIVCGLQQTIKNEH